MLIKYVVCPYGLVGHFACYVLSATTCKCMLAPLCHYIYHNVELYPCVLLNLNISDIANVLIHSDLDISCTQTRSALRNLVHSRSDILCTKTSRALGHLVHADHGTFCAFGHLLHSDILCTQISYNIGALDGGVPISHVDFKKWQCRMSLSLIFADVPCRI